MPEPVQGYITKAGRFFTTAEEAELNEAEVELVEALGGDEVDIISVIVTLQGEIFRFITALKAHAHAKGQTIAEAYQGNSDKPTGSGDTGTVLEQ